MLFNVEYEISFDLNQHLINVECCINNPSHLQKISIASWLPGSYMIRDFARLVTNIKAYEDNKELKLEKLSKNSWMTYDAKQSLVFKYSIYAFDQSPRGSFVDNLKVFFDSAGIFLKINGFENQKTKIKVNIPNDKLRIGWKLATSMKVLSKQGNNNDSCYFADNYYDLIDNPFLITEYTSSEFEIENVKHEIVVSGRHNGCLETLANDVKEICQAQANLFGSIAEKESYLFILNLTENGYGGIEHKSSCALVNKKENLPYKGMNKKSEGYMSLLGLFSHEYFHSYNVTRMKPLEFVEPNLDAEIYTKQLWIFEGITSYYDDLCLLRAGLISKKEYLNIFLKQLDRFLSSAGKDVQSLEESSFDAWVKLYKADENFSNENISYYNKGAIVAFALDITIRQKTNNKKSLDDVMRQLWKNYQETQKGLAQFEFEEICQSVTNLDLKDFFDKYVRSTNEINLKELFSSQKIKFQEIVEESIYDKENKKIKSKTDNNNNNTNSVNISVSLGVKFKGDSSNQVHMVVKGSCAQKAGISPNDTIIAIDSFKFKNSNSSDLLSRYQVNDKIKVHVFREDALLELEVLLEPNIFKQYDFNFNEDEIDKIEGHYLKVYKN